MYIKLSTNYTLKWAYLQMRYGIEGYLFSGSDYF